MVANLSAHKRGWDERWEEFSDWAEQGKALYEELLRLVDEDTAAFDGILAAFRLPQSSEAERSERHRAVQQATKRAIEVPLQVMQASAGVHESPRGDGPAREIRHRCPMPASEPSVRARRLAEPT